jgi:hypothetical protein
VEALITFWTHALAAALFASLTLWELRRGVGESEQRMLLAAFALTGIWAWTTAMAPTTMLAAYSETARNLVWVGVLYRLADIDGREEQRGVKPVYGAVAAVLGLQLLIDALPLIVETDGISDNHALIVTAIVLRLTAAAGSLVLVHNLYGQAAPSSRGNIRLAMIALAVMWAYDLNLYTIAYFDPSSALGLFDWRGLVRNCRQPRRSMADPPVARCYLPKPLAACNLRLPRRHVDAGDGAARVGRRLDPGVPGCPARSHDRGRHGPAPIEPGARLGQG